MRLGIIDRLGAHRVASLVAGYFLLAISACGFLVDRYAAVLRFPFQLDHGRSVVYRSDLLDSSAAPYEQQLLYWPAIGYAILAVAGILLMLRSVIWTSRPRLYHWMAWPAPWLIGYTALLLAVTGTRWVGFYLARRAEGQAPFELGPAPIFHLCTGALLMAISITYALRLAPQEKTWRLAAAAATISATGLLLAPLFPYGRVPMNSGSLTIDALLLATLAHETPFDWDAPHMIGLARGMAWAIFYVSFFVVISGWVAAQARAKPYQWIRQTILANLLFAAAGLGLMLGFYIKLDNLHTNFTYGYNVVFPLAFFGTMAVWIRQYQLRGDPDG